VTGHGRYPFPNGCFDHGLTRAVRRIAIISRCAGSCE
jgi:hypothetical protein